MGEKDRRRVEPTEEWEQIEFLPKALADGRYVAAPDPCVVGKGFDYVQAGMDI